MKVKMKNIGDTKKFYPIVIELETEAEAYALWHRLNMVSAEVAEITQANEKILTEVETQMMHRLDDYYTPED